MCPKTIGTSRRHRYSVAYLCEFFYYSSNWKCKSNKGIARFGLRVVVIEFWYSNHTVDVVEMSCKSLNNKRAMKNILSDDLWWNESVTCRENSSSVGMTYLFFRFLNAAEKGCEFLKQGTCKFLAGFILIKVIVVFSEKGIDDSKCSQTKSTVPFADTLIHLVWYPQVVSWTRCWTHWYEKKHLLERILAP